MQQTRPDTLRQDKPRQDTSRSGGDPLAARSDKRFESLLGALSEPRRAAIEPALSQLLAGGARPLIDPAWSLLALGLGRNLFDDLEITRPDLQRVVRLLHVQDESRLRVPGEVFKRVRLESMGKLTGLTQALELAGCEVEAERDFVRDFLFQLYVIALHKSLQLLYRVYLASRPFAPSTMEDDRVAHLAPLAPLAYHLVGFTHHCNIQCAHCYNFSGPKMKSERIATENMVRIVKGMPGAGMTNMNLTGGEPFMYLDTVLTLIGEARAAGVEAVTIYTNGFFAKTEEGCRKVLARLRDAGFMNDLGREGDHIKVSAGVFHQEFLPFETVINLIRVYREVFGKNVLVDYEILENRAEAQADIERELRDKGVADLVEIQFRRITPIGRAAQFDPVLRHLPAEQFGNCGVIDEIVFDPDGSVLPCCGMNFGNQGIVIGNIDDDDLRSLFRRLENNPILQYIAEKPIRDLFDYRGTTAAPKGYADLCSLCHHALGDLKENQDLKRTLSEAQDFSPVWFEAERLGIAP
jgi:MoaA/NifB/PqqE/SkfB family radical SAM enzyme